MVITKIESSVTRKVLLVRRYYSKERMWKEWSAYWKRLRFYKYVKSCF